jgi:hypothetical protein
MKSELLESPRCCVLTIRGDVCATRGCICLACAAESVMKVHDTEVNMNHRVREDGCV